MVALALLEEKTAGLEPSAGTVRDLLNVLEQEYTIQGRKSIEEMKHHVKPVLRLLGERTAGSLTPGVLRQYAATRQREGRANGTINRELAALRRAMNLAFQEGELTHVPKFPMLKETGLRQGTYTREEFDRIVSELPEHLKPVATFAYLTGRRRGEILQIQWEDINQEEGWIRIRANTTKTGEPDRIPLTGELLSLITGLREQLSTRVDTGFLFHYHGRGIKSFQRTWKKAVQRAGLPDKLFHDFRRSVATDLIESGVDQSTAMRITGHKTAAVFQRYRIVSSEAVKDGMARMAEYRTRKVDVGKELTKAKRLWPELP